MDGISGKSAASKGTGVANAGILATPANLGGGLIKGGAADGHGHVFTKGNLVEKIVGIGVDGGKTKANFGELIGINRNIVGDTRGIGSGEAPRGGLGTAPKV